MNSRLLRTCCAMLVVGFSLHSVSAADLGYGFTYQGRLVRNGTPVTNSCSFTFALFDDSTAGNEKGNSPQAALGVSVSNGLFSTKLDFGPNAINGEARWLEISVFCSGDASPATLSPRVELSPVPHALALAGMRTPQTANTPNVIGGTPENSTATGVTGATISGGGFYDFVDGEGEPFLLEDEHHILDHFGTISGGENNTAGNDDANVTSATHATVGGGYSNHASAFASTVGGGLGNNATGYAAIVSGGNNNDAVEYGSSIGGGFYNTSAGQFSTVAGGNGNMALNSFDTVSGGGANTASGADSTISGGYGNDATGYRTVIAGGSENLASANWSVISGGNSNITSEYTATISGGQSNVASGFGSMIPGGHENQAGGAYSFAGGLRSKVRDAATVGDSDGDEGTFIWNGSNLSNFTSTGPSQFLIRANGVGLNTNAPATVLHVTGGGDASLTAHGHMVIGQTGGTNIVMDDNEIIARNAGTTSTLTLQNDGGNVVIAGAAANSQLGVNRFSMSHPLHIGTNTSNGNGAHLTAGGVWTNGSDRNTKKNFEAIDPRRILDKVAALPIMKWQYKEEPDVINHIGPMAQDFYAAFKTGGDERYIGTIDADGVALAAIQGLNQIVKEKDCQIEQLEERVARLERLIQSTLTTGEGP